MPFCSWTSSITILYLSNNFKSKKGRQKFRCSFITKCNFPSVFLLQDSYSGPTGKHCGCQWMEHRSESPEVVFKLFWPSPEISAGSSLANCLPWHSTPLMTALVSLSEGCYSLVSRYKIEPFIPLVWKVLYSKVTLAFFCCLISELHPCQVQIWRWFRGSVLWSFAFQSAEQSGADQVHHNTQSLPRNESGFSSFQKGSTWKSCYICQNGPSWAFSTFLFSQTLEFNSMMEVRFKNVFRAVASGNFPRAKK